jgi:selenide,water dikinase
MYVFMYECVHDDNDDDGTTYMHSFLNIFTAGVFAVRAGPILCDNLIAYLLNQPLSPHEPQKEFLGLISTGNKYAVASRGQHALEGEFLWTLKDRIDKAWMSMYQNLPSMEEQNGDDRVEEEDAENKERQVDNTNNDYLPPSLTSRGQDAMAAFAEATMRCGGCGAKVGSQTLTRVLDAVYRRRLKKYESKFSSSLNAQLPKKLDADDAAVILIPESIIAKRGEGGNKRGAMIQTIDFFRSFLLDPFIFGKIAAVHALSDCHAMGAQAHTALALAVVQFAANEEMTERTLVDMLSGASDVLDEEGCELVGGHTCEGAEQALGFTVSGFVHDTSALLRKRGGKIGDLIVLTKPIGTGAIFAADMRAKCQGELVQEALDSMVTSNRSASRIAMNLIHARLQNNNPDRGIHSCTDITGFGLCGHLLEMLLANDDDNDNENDPSQPRHDRIAAQLNLGDIPFFQGAIEASKDGITSSLYRENSRSRRAVTNHQEAAETCPFTYPLLFDPQTAGGLLFFVSQDVCEEFVEQLSRDPGTKTAAIIGQLVEYKHDSWKESSCEIDNRSRTNRCKETTNRIYIDL